MSSLSALERRTLGRLLRLDSGYVLDFTNATFAEFFQEHGVDIDHERYRTLGDSKGKRLRAFWDSEPDQVVAPVLKALIDYGTRTRAFDDVDLLEEAGRIVARLAPTSSVVELEALRAPVDERDFETTAQQIREAIDRGQPEAALDRLHVFVMKFMRTICQQYGIAVSRDKPLHSIVGEYMKRLRENGHLESEMSYRIVKGSISVLEAFNTVRNNHSLAHDNPILNYEEALLIFNHVASSVRFIKALEDRTKEKNPTVAEQLDDQISF